MFLATELVIDEYVSLIYYDFPDELMKLAQSAESNLQDVNSSCKRVTASIALFALCRSQISFLEAEANRQTTNSAQLSPCDSLWQDWLRLGARQGALALRDYAKALSKLRALIGLIPAWRDAINMNLLKELEKQFDTKFPGVHKLRHSVAHPELYADPTKDMSAPSGHPGFATFVSGGGVKITVKEGLVNDSFTTTFEGDVVSYEVTTATATFLTRLTRQILAEFVPLNRLHR